jgi:hypothetical protein
VDAQLLERIRRLHVAIGRNNESDLAKFPAAIYSNSKGTVVVQDFSGGMSETEMSETLHGLIANIASFHDHLQKWGERHGVSGESIHSFLRASFDFCVVRDLWNNDKHGYPPHRHDGWTRKAPRLANVTSLGRVSVGPGGKGSAVMTLGLGGRPVARTKGAGSVGVILTGDVIDKNGNGLGDAHGFIMRAVSVCEAAVRRFVPK